VASIGRGAAPVRFVRDVFPWRQTTGMVPRMDARFLGWVVLRL
jgi:hypothetical protein